MVVSSLPASTGMAVCNVRGPVSDVELDACEFWRTNGDSRWRAIFCRRGEVWITQERDFQDYVLKAGEVFIVTQRGSVVVEALEDAAIQITPSLRTAPTVRRFSGGVFA